MASNAPVSILYKRQGLSEFFTVESNGDSGCNAAGLAILCGVSEYTIIQLEYTCLFEAISEHFEEWVGKDTKYRFPGECVINGCKRQVGIEFYKSDFCASAVAHYAEQGSKVAQDSFEMFVLMGIEEAEKKGWLKRV